MQLLRDILISLTSTGSIVFWLPLSVLTIAMLVYGYLSRDLIGTYASWTKAILALPSAVTLQILCIGIWIYSQEKPTDAPYIAMDAVYYLFLSLLPLTIFLIERFWECRRFVLLACLTQAWIALALTLQILIPLIRW